MTTLQDSRRSDEAEISVLGGAMLEVEAADLARELLTAGDFYHPAHALIFAAIGSLRDQGHFPEALAIRAELTRRGDLEKAGGSEYLARIVEIVSTAANTEYHASIVRDHSIRRALGAVGGWLSTASLNGHDTPDLLDEAEARLLAVTQHATGADEGTSLDQLVMPAMRFASSLQTRAIRTGLRDLDELTGGLRPSEFSIVGARPSQGKTALLVQIAYAAAQAGARVAFCSLEMGLHATALRFLACASGVPLVRLFKGERLEGDEAEGIEAAKRLFSGLPVSISTRPRTILDVRSFARRISRVKLDLLVVDYVQLLEASGETRAAEIGVITRGLKLLSLELDISILVAAQLNRTAALHQAPRLSDLKDSGSQEQDADNVWLLWRPDWGMTDREARSQGVKSLARVMVAKHRNGPTGTVDLHFEGTTATFALRTR